MKVRIAKIMAKGRGKGGGSGPCKRQQPLQEEFKGEHNPPSAAGEDYSATNGDLSSNLVLRTSS